MITVIVTIMTITGMSMCSANSYFDKKKGICAVLAVIVTIMTITGRYMCSANSYCDNNIEVYMKY